MRPESEKKYCVRSGTSIEGCETRPRYSGATGAGDVTPNATLVQCPECKRILVPTRTGKFWRHQVRNKNTASQDRTREILWQHRYGGQRRGDMPDQTDQTDQTETREVEVPVWWPDGGPERWMNTIASAHKVFLMSHERAYGAKIGELKNPTLSEADIQATLERMRARGELTSQRPEFTTKRKASF